MFIHTRIPRLFGAAAITVWPFIFVARDADAEILRHERVHLEQQRRWAIYGLGIGLLVWFALYLLVLPVGLNPWRERWEREAYRRGQRLTDLEITITLRARPYYLWWLR